MALWDLMTALCLVMPIAGALAVVKDTQKGWAGNILAVAIGLVLGGLCAWTMRAVGNKFAVNASPGKASQRPWHFRILYGAAMLWVVVALFLGSWATEMLLHVM